MSLYRAVEFGLQSLALRRLAASSDAKLHRIQQRRLARLLSHAQQHSPYLTDKYREIDPRQTELAAIPTSNKAELMENFETWLTVDDIDLSEVEQFMSDPARLGQLYRDKYIVSHTSGSEGQSLVLVTPQMNFQLIFALQAARGNHAGLSLEEIWKRFTQPVRLAAVTLQPAFFPSATAFAYMPPGARQYIEVLTVGINDDQLDAKLNDFAPTHITAYASILHELARRVEAGRLNLKQHLEQVVNISERLLPQSRKRYSELLGAPVFDDYGMGECLFLSSGCPDSGGMHVNADWAILEVVDESNQPVPPGTRGSKVLLTNLANHIQPIIRHEIGDMVTMATKPCQCGSQLPLIARVEGRSADIFRLNDHQVLHPAEFDHVLGSLPHIREYQIVQEQPTTFVVRVEPLHGKPVDEHATADALTRHLDEIGARHLQLRVEAVDRLTSSGDKKFKRVVPYRDAPRRNAVA